MEEVLGLPNVRRLLAPMNIHPAQELWHGLNILKTHINVDGHAWVCHELGLSEQTVCLNSR